MDSSALGPFSPLMDQVPETFRPYVLTAILAFAALVLIAQAVNPVLELFGRIARMFTLMGRSIARIFSRKSPAPPPAPPGLLPPIPVESTIWEIAPPQSPTYPIDVDRGGVPIITVANAKGGVGKTTTTANLAAYFKEKLAGQTRNKVLVIDFDYQGSLTQCLTGESGITEANIMTSHALLAGANSPDQALLFAREMRNGLSDVFLFAAEYPLATVENNVMINWARAPQESDDIRYRLCHILRSPAFQERFGVILIDVPPRMTTGTINALCASTHVVIPTTLDDMSAEAAGYFLKQLARMRDRIFPKLNVAAIIPSKVMVSTGLGIHEQRAADRLKGYGQEWAHKSDLVLIDAIVPNKSEIAAEAGRRVAYLHRRATRLIYKRLGDALQPRLK